MSAALKIEEELTEKERIVASCFADPVLFVKTFLHEHFYREVPPVHRAIFAILTAKARFLLKYGDISWIMKNFVHEYDEEENLEPRQIFHVYVDEVEVTWEKFKEFEDQDGKILIDHERIEIRLHLDEFTLILMPRGSSKTTIAGFAFQIYKILYQLERFSVYVSEAQKHTEAQLDSIRNELSRNEVIREYFGDIRPARADDEKWSIEKFETLTGIALQARGKGSAIRGITHKNRRPSTILVDDPQNGEDVASDAGRAKDKKWMLAELMPARARVVGSRGKILVLGTWLHNECLVAEMSRDPRFTTVKIEVKDLDGNFIWPDYMDQEQYDLERSSYERLGLLPQFYNEYHNKELPDSSLPFPSRFILYEPPPAPERLICATCLDPASSKARTADYAAVGTVGIDTKSGLVYVLDVWLKRGASDEEKMDEYFRQSTTWNTLLGFHGVESNGGQAAYGTLIKQEMFIRNRFFELTMITHKTRKIDRIRAALRPRYASGHIKHRVKFLLYQSQLLDFRYDNSHAHDDGPDVVAMCIVLLDPASAFMSEDDPGKDQFKERGDEDWNEAIDAEYEVVEENVQWAS